MQATSTWSKKLNLKNKEQEQRHKRIEDARKENKERFNNLVHSNTSAALNYVSLGRDDVAQT